MMNKGVTGVTEVLFLRQEFYYLVVLKVYCPFIYGSGVGGAADGALARQLVRDDIGFIDCKLTFYDAVLPRGDNFGVHIFIFEIWLEEYHIVYEIALDESLRGYSFLFRIF